MISKAPLTGAFFVVAAAVFPMTPGAHPSVRCAPDRVDERATVAYIYDGDTLRLTDGRKLRLIGIDSPEIGRDREPSQPFARRAKQALEEVAPPGTRVRLRYDEERRDKYRRILAHLFLGDGGSIQAEMLRRGLATALMVPPNHWNRSCYATAEAAARRAEAGIWRLPRYRPVSVDKLSPTARGFRIVTGRVKRAEQTGESVWLNMDGRLTVRIAQDDLSHFSEYDPLGLTGHRVLARGWLHGHGGPLRMTVRHPAALRLLE